MKAHKFNFKLLCLAAFSMIQFHVNAGIVRYVKPTASGTGDGSSWANASGDLQAMLTASTDGDSVWVAAGTYFPAGLPPGTTTVTTTDRDFAFYLPAGVKLYGGFAGTETHITDRNLAANITILDGDIGIAGNLTDNCYHVLILAQTAPANSANRVDGFTIQNGNANGTGNLTVAGRNYARINGGGISTILGLSTDLYYLTLKDNNSTGRGGGGFISSVNVLNIFGCTISSNSASGGNNDGGGIYLSSCSGMVCSNTFRNNQVSAVVSGNGAGLCLATGTLNIDRNTFYNNTCSRSGGGICISSGVVKITNNVLYNNQASLSGGGISLLSAPNDTVANNVFYANNATTAGGGGIHITTSSRLHNNIFSGNTFNGNSNTAGADIYRPVGAFDAVIAKNNLFQLAASSYTTTGTGNYDIGSTAVNNVFQLNPLFTNSSLPAGPDGIDRTTDDGLIPLSCSPAVNSGDQSLLPAGITSDITGAARTQLGVADMGAYERSNIDPDHSASIASTALTVIKTQSATVVYANDCNSLVATLTSSGASPVSGSTTSRVWIEAVQPNRFVKRHYEITPALNASTATGRITLYFTQQEFDDFNAANTVKLPMDPADGANYKANLLIEKRAGTSSDGSGLPASYSGTVSLIDPADTDITWNTALSRWEVSFDVTGFSGFFVKTTPLPLSVKWISFTGKINRLNQAELSWNVEEHFVTHYDVEKSLNGVSFTRAETIPGLGDGNHTYGFTDPAPLKQSTYYRIRQTDADGKTSYSSIITLRSNQPAATLMAFPNPVKNALNITSSKSQSARIVDAAGKTIRALQLPEGGTLSVNTEAWAKGLYLLITENGESIKLIRD